MSGPGWQGGALLAFAWFGFPLLFQALAFCLCRCFGRHPDELGDTGMTIGGVLYFVGHAAALFAAIAVAVTYDL